MSKNKIIRVRKAALFSFAVGTLIAVISGMLLYYNLRIPCVFNIITGLNCPGCGNTRAALYLMRFDIKCSLKMNLMFLPEIAFIAKVYIYALINYVYEGKFSYKSPRKWIDIVFLIVLLVWFVLRNLLKI